MNGFPSVSPLKSKESLSRILACDLEELLCVISFDALEDIVIASGSLVEGLGNKLSDIDLFIISPNSCFTRKKCQFYWQQAKRWVDVTLIELSEVENSFVEVTRNKGIPPLDWGTYIGARLVHLDLYHRLLSGITITTVQLPLNLTNLLSQTILSRELTGVQISLCRSFWNDAVGSFRSEQYKQAWYVARIALGHSIDAYSALLGQTNPGEKWRWAKVHRLEQDPLNVSKKLSNQKLECSVDARIEAEKALKECAELLFQVMHKLAFGYFVNYEHDLLPDQRYEVSNSKVVLLLDNGLYESTEKTFSRLD